MVKCSQMMPSRLKTADVTMKHCHLTVKLLEWESSYLLKIYHLYAIYHTEKASVYYKKQPPSELFWSQLHQLRTLSTAPG